MVATCGGGASHWTSDAGSCTAAEAAEAAGAGGASAVLFGALLASLLRTQRRLGDSSAYPADAADRLKQSYDFVVLGAGSAGAAVAARLSESAQWSVLLLEAGGDPTAESDVPALMTALPNTDMDWAYRTEPEDGSGGGLKGGRRNWVRGKGLGGTSSVNGNLYMRPHKCDFERWVSEGAEGWGYDDVLPLFKKAENFEDEDLLRAHPHLAAFHGRGGPVNIRPHHLYTPLGPAFLRASEELGYRRLHDVSGDKTFGTGAMHGTIVNGMRCSSARAYLSPAKDRPNLHVVKHALVTKVIIDPDTKQVRGVQFKRTGEDLMREVEVDKEVVVSGGAVGSPQILMLSGIGPREHLEALGIPVVADLPVGDNLQDHVMFPGIVLSLDDVPQMDMLDATYFFLKNGTGPLTSNDLSAVTTVVDSRAAPGKEDEARSCPDVQVFHFPLPKGQTEAVRAFLSLLNPVDEVENRILELNKQRHLVLVFAGLMRPRSRGTLRLRSADPNDKPIIKAGYLSDLEDKRTLVAASEAALRLADTKALRRLGARLEKVVPPGCRGVPFATRDFWDCAATEMATCMFHPAGSCRMGARADAAAVVDPQLRVRGIRGLRVADASVMPSIVSSVPNAACIMIGEKVSQMIKEAWWDA